MVTLRKNYFNFFVVVIFSVLFLAVLSVAPASAETISNPCPYGWKRNLHTGITGDDVLKLQQFLNSYPETVIALSGAGSSGKESVYYGSKTALAVKKFQEKFKAETLAPAGLIQGSGFFGTLTRAKLNSLCNSGSEKLTEVTMSGIVTPAPVLASAISNSPAPAAENALTISAPAQPETTLAPAGAGGVKFTLFTLTAGSEDVTVYSITVERVGWGADGSFDSVALFDENGSQIGAERSFRSNHKVDLGDPFIISAGTSKTFSIEANMASDLSSFDGQMPVLQIVSVNTSSKVLGSLPIRGTAQTVNTTLIIGGATASLSQFDPAASLNRYINDTNVRFSGIRLTANSKENLTLSSITWDQAGNAGNGDIANVVTVVNDKFYPTEIGGRKYTSTFEPPILIPKGYSLDLYIQGDLKTSGANRTVEFDIRKSGDIALFGNSYGFYVIIYADGNTAMDGHSVFITSTGDTDGDEGSPFFSGSVITINGGTFTGVGKSI